MKRLAFLLLLGLPIPVFAEGGLPNQPYIYVMGKAEIDKPADMVTLRFDVVGHAADQPKANQEVQGKALKIFDLLKEHKVADSDVVAENIRSEPEYEDQSSYPHRGKVIGFMVTRSFEAKLRDIAAFPKVVDELLKTNGLEFSSVESGLSKRKEIEDQLWDKALKDARDQAERTVKAMNMRIDSVFAVPPEPFTAIQSKIFGSEERVVVTGSNVPVQEPEYRLSTITVTQTVHVIYLISPTR